MTKLALVLLVVSSVAVADDALTLPRGKIALAAAAQSDLSTNGDSLSVAPDLAYGVTDGFTVALVHTTQGATGFWSGLGTGSLCVMGERCTDMYSTGALLTKLELVRDGSVTLAALAGVVYNVDPFLVGAGIGGEVLVPVGGAAVHFKPTMYIGINDRDGMVPNKELVNLPLALLVPATAKLTVGVQTGLAAPLAHFKNAYRVPVAVMGNVALGAMTAGLAFSFDRVAGGDDGMDAPGALDTRSLTLTLGWVN